MVAFTLADSSPQLHWNQNSWQHVLRLQLWKLLLPVFWRFSEAASFQLQLLLPQQQCFLFSKELPARLLFLQWTAGDLRGAPGVSLTLLRDQILPGILLPAQAVLFQALPRRLCWIFWIWQFGFWIFRVWELWHSLSGLWLQLLPPRLLFFQEYPVVLLPARL